MARLSRRIPRARFPVHKTDSQLLLELALMGFTPEVLARVHRKVSYRHAPIIAPIARKHTN